MNETTVLFERYRPTHVLHLAALVGGLFKNMHAPLDMLRHNVLMNDHVLENCHQFNVTVPLEEWL